MRANGRRLQGLGGQGGAMRKGSGDLQWGTSLLWGRGTKKGSWKSSNRQGTKKRRASRWDKYGHTYLDMKIFR